MPTGKNPEPRKKYKKAAIFNYQIEKYIDLPQTHTNANISFFDVIRNRRSEKNFKKLSITRLSHLLRNAAKAQKTFLSEYGTLLSHRTAPSAGAIHPIDIFISLPITLENRRLYYYEPFTHKLGRLILKESELKSFFKNINDCLKSDRSTIMWFAAHPDRTAIKYINSESLVWRDAGALIMTVQLVATAFNIKSCPVGTLGEPFLSKSFGKNLISAGGLLLG